MSVFENSASEPIAYTLKFKENPGEFQLCEEVTIYVNRA